MAAKGHGVLGGHRKQHARLVIRFRTLAEIFSSKARHGWNGPSGIFFSWCLEVRGPDLSAPVLS